MTVSMLLSNVSSEELAEWMFYFQIKAQAQSAASGDGGQTMTGS